MPLTLSDELMPIATGVFAQVDVSESVLQRILVPKF